MCLYVRVRVCVCACACACACARVCALGRCSRRNAVIRVVRDSNKKHRLKKKIEDSNNSYATVDIPVYEYNVLFLFIAF